MAARSMKMTCPETKLPEMSEQPVGAIEFYH
ncbi:hypothetical protein BY447_2235 [Pantoea sp. JKS000250]|jgi:hypothetical protein|nr:hypothetical protein BY447_2235 [Pantoea sp. JKS000250]